jgi:ABC-2 type transport system ATP-binding protein
VPVDKKIMELSKGTKTKAMLALTLAHQPDLLILDEPTAGLDPVARIELLDILRDYVSDGEKSVLFSTHITSDLDKVADYITIINNGKIIESLSIDKIEEKYVIISGASDELQGHESEFVGIRKGSSGFEGLLLREKATIKFPQLEMHTPNIENMLTFSIWGNKQ